MQFTNFQYFTKYQKKRYAQIRKDKRNHYILDIDTVSFTSIYLDSILTNKNLSSSQLNIINANFEINNNKTLPNGQQTYSALYGEYLKSIPWKLNIDTTTISKTYISYTEISRKDSAVAELEFNDINALITNLSNTDTLPIDIDVNCSFMRDSQTNVFWKIWPHSDLDDFSFEATVHDLEAHKLNAFATNNGSLSLSGDLSKTRLSVSGNKDSALCAMEMSYKNLDFKVIDQRGKIKKIKTWIINLFMSDEKRNSVVTSKCQTINEREEFSSWWSFLWLNIRASMIECLT